jgi:serum/glucocorticoid-regulated kinase 2
MKEMSKVKAFIKKSLGSILLEKQILSSLHYSLIANLNFSFQDKEYLYLVLDYLPGGDLRYYMSQRIIFNESQIKFIISNLILSLKYIHSNNILHRDIKPENLVFDDKGYIHLTDFGISRKIKNGKSILNKSGTPGYISPEVLLNKPQGFSSDFFSVGVICYELLLGKKPFKGKNKKEIAEKILYKNIKLTKKDIPENYSIIMGDFINKLLKRNKHERLGNKSIDEIMNHSWLEGVDWKIIELKLVDSEYIPFVPSIGDNFDSNVANKKDNMNMEHYEENLKKINDSGYFKHFYFNYYSNINITKTKLIHEKTSISHKYTTVTEGMKSTPTQSEGDPESNDISIGNNNNISLIKSISIQNFENNSDLNKKNGQTDSDFPKKSKTNYIKSTSLLKKRIIYDKGQFHEVNKSNLSKEKEGNESFNNNEYNENEKIS